MPARRPTRTVLVAVSVALAAAVAFWAVSGGDTDLPRSGEPGVFDPVAWVPDAWTDALGGDPAAPGDPNPVPTLPWDPTLTGDDITDLDRLARDVATAELTGARPDGLDGYFAVNHVPVAAAPTETGTRYCTGASVLAVAGARLPYGDGVKLVVVWRADCPYPPPSAGPGDVAVSFVYATPTGDLDPAAAQWGGWVPVHPITLPGAAAAARGAGRTPSTWELEPLTGCARPGLVARGEVTFAWEALCVEATAAGVPLTATVGWRSPQQQQDLWDEAVARWGVDEATRRVAYSDGERCLSRHCAGEAVDVVTDPTVLAWLTEPVGCLVDGTFTAGTAADCGGSPVARVARYGFAFTIPSSPGHLDYLAGTTDLDAEQYGDCTPGPVAVPELLRLVFTCRALEAGVGFDDVTAVADAAVTVARCTSALNPASVAWGGRYTTTPNPATGALDDRTGLFGLSAAVASNHVVGGPDARTDAWANIDGAARLWVHERTWGRWGWDPFGCASGDDGNGTRVLG